MASKTSPSPTSVRNLGWAIGFIWLAISWFTIWNHSTGLIFFIYLLPIAWHLFKTFKTNKASASYQVIYSLITFAGLWNHDLGFVLVGSLLAGIGMLIPKFR